MQCPTMKSPFLSNGSVFYKKKDIIMDLLLKYVRNHMSEIH